MEEQRQLLLKKKLGLTAENKKRKDKLAELDKDLEKFIDVCCSACRSQSHTDIFRLQNPFRRPSTTKFEDTSPESWKIKDQIWISPGTPTTTGLPQLCRNISSCSYVRHMQETQFILRQMHQRQDWSRYFTGRHTIFSGKLQILPSRHLSMASLEGRT